MSSTTGSGAGFVSFFSFLGGVTSKLPDTFRFRGVPDLITDPALLGVVLVLKGL